MSWHRRRHPIRASGADENTEEIVTALRKVGASVLVLTAIGDGTPDLLVGVRGEDFLLEIKREPKPGSVKPSQAALRASQVHFAASWRGRRPATVHTAEEALAAVGISATPMLDRARAWVETGRALQEDLDRMGAGRKR